MRVYLIQTSSHGSRASARNDSGVKEGRLRLTRRQPIEIDLRRSDGGKATVHISRLFRESANRQIERHSGMEIYEPRLAVVVGRSSDFIDAQDRQKLQSTISDVGDSHIYDIRLYANRRRLLVEGE